MVRHFILSSNGFNEAGLRVPTVAYTYVVAGLAVPSSPFGVAGGRCLECSTLRLCAIARARLAALSVNHRTY